MIVTEPDDEVPRGEKLAMRAVPKATTAPSVLPDKSGTADARWMEEIR